MEITYINDESSTELLSDSGLTATDEDVLSPYKYIGADGVESVGKMENIGTVSVLLRAGDSYSVPKGYHSGMGIVSAISLADQTVSSVTKDKLVVDKTAWSNGKMITGELNLGLQEDVPEGMSYTSPSLYVYIKEGAYKNTSNFVSINNTDLINALGIDLSYIALGSNIFGQSGLYTEDATATENVVRNGKTVYANGKKIVGKLEIPTLF